MGAVEGNWGIGTLVMLCLWGCQSGRLDVPPDSAMEREATPDTGDLLTDSKGPDRVEQEAGILDSGIETICDLPAVDCPGVGLPGGGVLACDLPGVTCSWQVGAPGCDWRCTCGADGVWSGCDVCCAGPIP